jgi:capsular polysaccharide biosynthesis protein
VTDYLPLPLNRKGLTLQKLGVYGSIKPRNAPLLEGRFTSVWGKWAHVNYYHWLIDCLPQLACLGETGDSPPITLLMPEFMPAVWEDSLACCLPTGMAVQRATGWVRPEHFVFVSPGHPSWAAWLAASEREYMRGKVFERFNLDAARQPTRRIFVSRSRAAMRRLLNKDEAGQVMASFGFENVHLEDFCFEQQVRLFHDAEFIAGVHGAAFANLLFASRAKVLELFARNEFKPLYFFLARSLGLDHEFLLGSEANRLEDFSIDITELARTLERMLSGD